MTDFNSFEEDDGFIGVGTPWFKPHGSEKAFYWGNPVSLTLENSSETKVRVSRCKEDSGASKDANPKPNPTTGKYVTDSFTPKTWALMMMGDSAEKAVPVKTIPGEPVKAVLDGYADLAEEDIDESTFKVYNAGVEIDAQHYEFKASMGYLRIRESANITEGTDLTVDYQTSAEEFLEIESNKVTSFTGEFGLDGINTVNDRKCKFYAPNMSMSVNGTFDWFSDDFNTIEATTNFSMGKEWQEYKKPTRIRYYT